jgi:hypothetical protein
MRDWWLRVLLVLQRPRPVFAALRDDSREAAGDRAEPVLLVVLLAGIAVVLFTSTAAHLDDDGTFDGLTIAVWAFVVGSVNGLFGYFALGAILHGGVKAFGSQGSYRRSRHLLAFAVVPVALSLVAWPFRLALYGKDWFRSGGGDIGTGGDVFDLIQLAFFAWAAGLLVVGVRAVHGWTWARAGAASAFAVAAPVVVAVLVQTLSSAA